MHVLVWGFGVIALISLLSVLSGRPWTAVIARRSNPPEVWSSKLFHETNMVISGAWALLFAAAALLAAYASLRVNLGYGLVLSVLGYLSPRFGAWYSSRRRRAMESSGPPEGAA